MARHATSFLASTSMSMVPDPASHSLQGFVKKLTDSGYGVYAKVKTEPWGYTSLSHIFDYLQTMEEQSLSELASWLLEPQLPLFPTNPARQQVERGFLDTLTQYWTPQQPIRMAETQSFLSLSPIGTYPGVVYCGQDCDDIQHLINDLFPSEQGEISELEKLSPALLRLFAIAHEFGHSILSRQAEPFHLREAWWRDDTQKQTIEITINHWLLGPFALRGLGADYAESFADSFAAIPLLRMDFSQEVLEQIIWIARWRENRSSKGAITQQPIY